MKNSYALLLVSILALSGCMTTPALPEQQRPAHWGQLIHKNHNLYQISEELYRSEQPSHEFKPLLKQHEINVVINLRARDKDSDVLANDNLKLRHIPIHTWAIDREDLLTVMREIQQARQNNDNLKLRHIPIHTWAIDREDLLTVMREIQQARQNKEKVLLHCYHGSDRTGASIAMYRIIFQNWAIEDAIQEMKHGGYGFHRVWRNIENLFSPENVKWIREQLSNPSTEISANEKN